MIEKTPFCDGCGAKMTWEEYADSLQVAAKAVGELLGEPGVDAVQQTPESPAYPIVQIPLYDQRASIPVIVEIFCPACRINAVNYWKEKVKLIQESSDESHRRFTKHRRAYFETLKAKVRKIRKPVVPPVEELSESLRSSQPN